MQNSSPNMDMVTITSKKEQVSTKSLSNSRAMLAMWTSEILSL